MTTEALEYYINLVDKAVAGFEKMGSNFEKKKAVLRVKYYQKSLYATKNTLWKKSQHSKPWLSNSEKLPQPPQPSETTTPISQQPSTLVKSLQKQKDAYSLKAWMTISIF